MASKLIGKQAVVVGAGMAGLPAALGSLLTRRWRDMDSKFQFRARGVAVSAFIR
jgi:2-polyprenyl-6-methoxyphenol hydroxylase-like FAD-dependent oxidoreductase